MAACYDAQELTAFARALLTGASLEPDKAHAVAEILVEGDLLGHTTHGLQLLAPYLREIENGRMQKAGQPRIVADHPAAVTWDGLRLPGPWLTIRAVDLAIERARKLGTCTVVIRRSHHIACLAAYLKRVTDLGLMVLLVSSGPDAGGVAPHGGLRGVYTPNPVAAAWPTSGDPVILDISMSIVSHGLARRYYDERRRFPGPWVIDTGGKPSDDPAVMFNEPRGALLPIGDMDHGHKGYALALLVEAITGGLSGHGRADPQEGWSANVFVQVFDPELYVGEEDFTRQTSWLADACRNSPPRPGFDRVRLPGEAALRRRATQLKDGLELHPSVLPSLSPWMEKLAVDAPARL